jgi:hypothetical protein
MSRNDTVDRLTFNVFIVYTHQSDMITVWGGEELPCSACLFETLDISYPYIGNCASMQWLLDFPAFDWKKLTRKHGGDCQNLVAAPEVWAVYQHLGELEEQGVKESTLQ